MGRTACVLLVCGLGASACSRVNPLFSDVAEGSAEGGSSGTTGTKGTLPTNADGDVDGSDSGQDGTTGSLTESTSSPLTSDPTIAETEGDTRPGVIDVPRDCDYYGDPCDLAEGCDEGFKCAPVGDPKNGFELWCVEVQESPRTLGDACVLLCEETDGVDDCDVGLFCVAGACRALCLPADEICNDVNDSCFTDPSAPFGVCLPSCDPLAQDCGIGFTCIPDPPSTFVCLPDASDDGADQGATCVFANSCNPGFMCIEPEDEGCGAGTGCCSAYCDLGSPVCANAEHECQVVLASPSPGYETVGVCALPAG